MKVLEKVRGYGSRIAAVVTGTLVSVAAFATPDPYSAVTDALDWTPVLAVIGTAAGALAVVYVFRKGARLAVGMAK